MLCSQGGFYTIPNFLFLFSFSLYSLSAGLPLSCIPQHSQKIFLVIKWFVMFIKSVAFPHITPLPCSFKFNVSNNNIKLAQQIAYSNADLVDSVAIMDLTIISFSIFYTKAQLFFSPITLGDKYCYPGPIVSTLLLYR